MMRYRSTPKDYRPRKKRSMEVRLRATHMVFLLGLTAGCMALAFYFGFNSGQKFGFEMSSLQSLAETARLPIVEPSSEEKLSERFLNEVYAKLSGDTSLEELDALAAEKSKSTIELALKEEVESTRSEVESTIVENRELADPVKEEDETSPELKVEEKSVIASLGSIRNEEVLEANENVKASLAPVKGKAEEKSTESVATVEAPSKIRSGWYAQVAAPRQQSDAQQLVRTLKEFGFSAAIEEARIRDESYYRVLVGPEQNKVYADRLLDQIKREPYIEAEPFLRSFP